MPKKASKKKRKKRKKVIRKKTKRKKRKKIKTKKRVQRKQKKTIEKEIVPSLLRFRGIKMKVIGIGGGGGSIVSEIAPKLKRVKFLVANTDWQALKTSAKEAERFQFGQSLTRGLGTGMDSQLGETAALNEKEKIKRIFQGEDLSILVATLGGGVGSGAGPVFAKTGRNSRNLTLGIFTLPFEFEGKKRREIAESALEKLKPDLNVFSLIPNERIFQIIDQKTPLKEALSEMNKILAANLEGLIEMIHSPGLINIDFADLKAALEGRGRLAYLATIEAQGENRAEEAIKRILQSPLYEYGIQGAERILFNISGSKNLTISEVEKISRSIANFNPKAKIIFGLSQKDSYQNKVKITLLAVGCGKREEKERNNAKKRKRKKRKEKEISENSFKKETKVKIKKEKKKELKPKVSKTALDLRKELDKTEKDMASKESEWDIPTFLRKRSLKLK